MVFRLGTEEVGVSGPDGLIMNVLSPPLELRPSD